MIQAQYEYICTHFCDYARVHVEFMANSPRSEKTAHYGVLLGVGVGANADTLIIGYIGESLAIPYEDIKFPR